MPFDDRAPSPTGAQRRHDSVGPVSARPLIEHRLTLTLADGTVLERPDLRVRSMVCTETVGEPLLLRVVAVFAGDADRWAQWFGADARLELWRGDDVRAHAPPLERARYDSNIRPSGSKPDALSN